jgi:hypothetical protein
MTESRMAGARSLWRFLRPGALGLFLILEGCAGMGSSNPFVDASNTDSFLLRVESRNTYDVTVYINPAGRRILVGTVPGNGLEFLEFEYPAGRPINVELETRAGERYRLPPYPVTSGGRLNLYVNSRLRSSGFGR